MKRTERAAFDDLCELFQAWVDASMELRAAILQRSPRVQHLNESVHDALQCCLRAMEMEADRMGGVKPGTPGTLPPSQTETETAARVAAETTADKRETHLQMARRHVAGGRRIIAEQERRIANLRSDGRDTTRAAQLLDTERAILVEMQALLVHEGEAVPRR